MLGILGPITPIPYSRIVRRQLSEGFDTVGLVARSGHFLTPPNCLDRLRSESREVQAKNRQERHQVEGTLYSSRDGTEAHADMCTLVFWNISQVKPRNQVRHGKQQESRRKRRPRGERGLTEEQQQDGATDPEEHAD